MAYAPAESGRLCFPGLSERAEIAGVRFHLVYLYRVRADVLSERLLTSPLCAVSRLTNVHEFSFLEFSPFTKRNSSSFQSGSGRDLDLSVTE